VSHDDPRVRAVDVALSETDPDERSAETTLGVTGRPNVAAWEQ